MVTMEILKFATDISQNILAKVKSYTVLLIGLLPEDLQARIKVQRFLYILDIYIFWIKEMRSFVEEMFKPKPLPNIYPTEEDSGTETDGDPEGEGEAEAAAVAVACFTEAKRIARNQAFLKAETELRRLVEKEACLREELEADRIAEEKARLKANADAQSTAPNT